MIERDFYPVALSDVCSAYPAFRPPRRVRVSEGAARSLVIKQPGGASGNWDPDETPYMVEPVDMLASRLHTGLVFVGPARTGKTMGLIDGWITHAVVNDPGDFGLFQMTQEKAREFSKVRIDRMLKHSPDLAALKSSSAQDDNTHDKQFKHGMWLRIAWPTVSNMSSSDYRYVGLTDFDRMPDDIGGEGSPWFLALKRTQTFLSRGMAMAESSPGRPIKDPNWKPATAHEAPPATGILGLYNTSDRRRWYWRCLDCTDWFEAAPGLGLFRLPPDEQLVDIVREANLDTLAGEYNRVICPHCGSIIKPKLKRELNRHGKWVPDGLTISGNGELSGVAQRSNTLGYWLGGVAAAYQSWKSMLQKHLQGLRDYALTGDELILQTTCNTDAGMPYLSMHLRETAAAAKDPSKRLSTELARFVVPDETRFVVASVDVQGGTSSRFSVQVHAVGPHAEQWLIDRYEIKQSQRPGMGDEFAPIDPGGYSEDWDIITERIVRATYRTSDEQREIRVKRVIVDTGGEAGVTERAYAWYRRLRKVRLHTRVVLYKGGSTKGAPIVKESMVGKRHGREVGDIPLYVCNTNLLSDAVDTGLKRGTPGPGFIHFPEWLPKAFFDELQAEVRSPTGVWVQVRKRNESFDHCRMIRALLLVMGVDKMRDWATERVPAWARPVLEGNSETITADERREMQANEATAPVPDDEAPEAPPPRIVAPRPVRRMSHSPYLT